MWVHIPQLTYDGNSCRKMANLLRTIRYKSNYEYGRIVGPTKLTYHVGLYLRHQIKLTTLVENCDGFSNLLLEQKRRLLSVINWELMTDIRLNFHRKYPSLLQVYLRQIITLSVLKYLPFDFLACILKCFDYIVKNIIFKFFSE